MDLTNHHIITQEDYDEAKGRLVIGDTKVYHLDQEKKKRSWIGHHLTTEKGYYSRKTLDVGELEIVGGFTERRHGKRTMWLVISKEQSALIDEYSKSAKVWTRKGNDLPLSVVFGREFARMEEGKRESLEA